MLAWLKLVAAIVVAEVIEHTVESIFVWAKGRYKSYRSRVLLRRRSKELYR